MRDTASAATPSTPDQGPSFGSPEVTLPGGIPAVSGRLFPRLSRALKDAIDAVYEDPADSSAAATCRALATLMHHRSARVRRQAEALLSPMFTWVLPRVGGDDHWIWTQPWAAEAVSHLLRDPLPQGDSLKYTIAQNLQLQLFESPRLSFALADSALSWLSMATLDMSTPAFYEYAELPAWKDENDPWYQRADAAVCVLSALPPTDGAIRALHSLAVLRTPTGIRKRAAAVLLSWLEEEPLHIRQAIANLIFRAETGSRKFAVDASLVLSHQRLDLVVAAVSSVPSLLADEVTAAAIVSRAKQWPQLAAAAATGAGWISPALATALRRGRETDWSIIEPWLESVTSQAAHGSLVAQASLAQCTEDDINLWLQSSVAAVRKLAWLAAVDCFPAGIPAASAS